MKVLISSRMIYESRDKKKMTKTTLLLERRLTSLVSSLMREGLPPSFEKSIQSQRSFMSTYSFAFLNTQFGSITRRRKTNSDAVFEVHSWDDGDMLIQKGNPAARTSWVTRTTTAPEQNRRTIIVHFYVANVNFYFKKTFSNCYYYVYQPVNSLFDRYYNKLFVFS